VACNRGGTDCRGESAKVIELSKELNLALDQQELGEKYQGRVGDTNRCVTKVCGWTNYEKIVDDAVRLMRSDYASLQMLHPKLLAERFVRLPTNPPTSACHEHPEKVLQRLAAIRGFLIR
jgi:hypothetical protein